MPCYSTITTELLDIASIEAAAKKLGFTVSRSGDNAITISSRDARIVLTRSSSKEKFRSSQFTGQYESMLAQLVPAYAKVQLQKFAQAKGYSISKGSEQDQYVLTRYE